ncbi:hypothetical protein AB1Y20_000643 [Prymnesium parvum]|uniref:Uncharacterized protein n=1 Tax=Prymnesium parvum TaxID=97485 RepID=A0AB34JPN2_PRYPA|mmetsp:Transcript_44308/g.78190  ORF Transcript_44308/g.78190 Transcript_44308/m.78190 type:complete len:324 (+) Transcript_44308:23-994(+)
MAPRLAMLLLLPAASHASALPPTVPTAHADAFTSVAFCGNPACVVLLPAAFPSAEWMQRVANEMHLSETAFLVPHAGHPSSYDLRWFTPTDEVALCGHATLASSAVLWEVHCADASAPLTFHTKSGVLQARRDAEGVIWLDFPSAPALAVEEPRRAAYRARLAAALGLGGEEDIVWVGRNSIGGPGGGDLIVEVTPEAFASLAPAPSEIKKVGCILECRVLSVTCAGCPASVPLPPGGHPAASYDFSSRGFAPCVGVDEDPVCGSAHCALAPYWATKLGKSSMFARVASARGGDVRVNVQGDRVELGGRAVITMIGNLRTSSN